MSNKKKNAIKRNGRGGKRPGETYAASLKNYMQQEQMYGNTMGKILDQEVTILALKRMGILGPKRLQQLHEKMMEVWKEYATLQREDIMDNHDKEFIYTKYKFDEEFKAAVGEENFVDWDMRRIPYFYSSGIRTIELKQEYPANIKALEMKREELAKKAAEEIGKEVEDGDYFSSLSIEERDKIVRTINNATY